MAMQLVNIVVILATCSVLTSSKNPGLQMRISEKGIQYVSDISLNLLKKSLADTKIPDIYGDTRVGVVGTITYSLTNMKITNFNLPTASISTVINKGIKLTINKATIALDADWSYHNHGFISIRDDGSFDVKASSITFTLILKIGKSADGHFTLLSSKSDCHFNVGSLNVNFHGGASWLYNLFKDTIANSLKSSLNEKMCDEIISEVNGDLAHEVDNFNLVLNIDDYSYIDYSLVLPPQFAKNMLESFHKGEVLSRKDHQDIPVPAPAIPADAETSRMVYLWLTEYATSSAAYVYYKAGTLQYNITSDMIPAPYSLNTSRFPFSNLIPQIAKHYPNMDMTIISRATSPPVCNMTSTEVIAGIVGQLDFFVVEKKKTLVYLFSLALTLDLAADVAIDTVANKLTANFTLKSLNIKFIKSSPVIGDISSEIASMKPFINLCMSLFVMPLLNQKGSEGLPIPSSDGFQLVNPSISFGKGFLRISSDVKYTDMKVE